ncbi:hypothetical protein VTN96DRAFT_1731 [Rasamsonia emersonii]
MECFAQRRNEVIDAISIAHFLQRRGTGAIVVGRDVQDVLLDAVPHSSVQARLPVSSKRVAENLAKKLGAIGVPQSQGCMDLAGWPRYTCPAVSGGHVW